MKKKTEIQPEWLNQREAAALMGVCRQTLAKNIRTDSGLQVARLPSGSTLIHRESLNRWLASRVATV